LTRKLQAKKTVAKLWGRRQGPEKPAAYPQKDATQHLRKSGVTAARTFYGGAEGTGEREKTGEI